MTKHSNSKQSKLQPTLLKYLLSNIDKGILPTEEELTEIQNDLGTSWLADINLALLSHINNNKVSKTAPKQSQTPLIEMVSQPQQQNVSKPLPKAGVGYTPIDAGRVKLIGGAK